MTETLTGFAALAVIGFIAVFALLLLFMMLVQPIWSVIDCAIDEQRSTGGKVLWILALILLWGVANWFYGAFAAANRTLRALTRLTWALAIVLIVLFVVLFYQSTEFRRGIEREWRDFGDVEVVQRPPACAPSLGLAASTARTDARTTSGRRSRA